MTYKTALWPRLLRWPEGSFFIFFWSQHFAKHTTSTDFANMAKNLKKFPLFSYKHIDIVG